MQVSGSTFRELYQIVRDAVKKPLHPNALKPDNTLKNIPMDISSRAYLKSKIKFDYGIDAPVQEYTTLKELGMLIEEAKK